MMMNLRAMHSTSHLLDRPIEPSHPVRPHRRVRTQSENRLTSASIVSLPDTTRRSSQTRERSQERSGAPISRPRPLQPNSSSSRVPSHVRSGAGSAPPVLKTLPPPPSPPAASKSKGVFKSIRRAVSQRFRKAKPVPIPTPAADADSSTDSSQTSSTNSRGQLSQIPRFARYTCMAESMPSLPEALAALGGAIGAPACSNPHVEPQPTLPTADSVWRDQIYSLVAQSLSNDATQSPDLHPYARTSVEAGDPVVPRRVRSKRSAAAFAMFSPKRRTTEPPSRAATFHDRAESRSALGGASARFDAELEDFLCLAQTPPTLVGGPQGLPFAPRRLPTATVSLESVLDIGSPPNTVGLGLAVSVPSSPEVHPEPFDAAPAAHNAVAYALTHDIRDPGAMSLDALETMVRELRVLGDQMRRERAQGAALAHERSLSVADSPQLREQEPQVPPGLNFGFPNGGIRLVGKSKASTTSYADGKENELSLFQNTKGRQTPKTPRGTMWGGKKKASTKAITIRCRILVTPPEEDGDEEWEWNERADFW